MDPRWVTVAAFSHPLEAHVAKTKLESEGIECFIADENLVGANWLYSNAVGGVKVQVHAPDAEKARALLAVSGPAEAGPPPDRCPKCGSEHIRRASVSHRLAFLSLFLVALPLPFSRRKWTCADCEHRWKNR